jgi:hypothetical protein
MTEFDKKVAENMKLFAPIAASPAGTVTPRSAAEWNLHEPRCSDGSQLAEMMFNFACTLERELTAARHAHYQTHQVEIPELKRQLAAAQAEIARLKERNQEIQEQILAPVLEMKARKDVIYGELAILKQSHADTLAKLEAAELQIKHLADYREEAKSLSEQLSAEQTISDANRRVNIYLGEQLAAARSALQEIASQKTIAEICGDADITSGDFEGAYDMCVRRARAAMSPEGKEQAP